MNKININTTQLLTVTCDLLDLIAHDYLGVLLFETDDSCGYRLTDNILLPESVTVSEGVYLDSVDAFYNKNSIVTSNTIYTRILNEDSRNYLAGRIGSEKFTAAQIAALSYTGQILGSKLSDLSWLKYTNITALTAYTSIIRSLSTSASKLTKVELPDTLTYIKFDYNKDGFAGSKITEIDLKNVNTMGMAFTGISTLKNVIIRIPYTETYTSYGSGSFFNCTGILKVLIKDVDTFLNCTFSNYASNPLNCGNASLYLISDPETPITSVTYSNSVTSVKAYLFYNLKTLTDVKFEEDSTCTSIGTCAFYSTGITSIDIPSSVTTISSLAFESTKLQSISIPSTVTSLGTRVFKNCTSLSDATIADSRTVLPASLFYGCTSLKEIDIKNVTTLNGGNSINDSGNGISGVFSRCTNLATVTNAENLTYIGAYSFYNCTKLSLFDISNATYIGAYSFYNCTKFSGNITFNDGLTTIGSNAFTSTNIIFNGELPNTLTTLGTQAFYKCINFKITKIPDGITTLNYGTFYGTGIENINLNNVTTFGTGAGNGNHSTFGGSSLKTVTAPNITNVYNYVFCAASELTSIDAPNVTSIGTWAFYSCNNLSTINFGSLTSIGSNAFMACYKLTLIDLSNVTTLLSCAFLNCTGLTSITLSSNLDWLNKATNAINRVFSGCTSLTTVNFNGLTLIPHGWGDDNGSNYGQFYNCSKLTTLTGTEYLTSIGNYSFVYCKSLQSIKLPNLTSLGIKVFMNCTSLTSIYVPNIPPTASASGFNGSCIPSTAYIYVSSDDVKTLYTSTAPWSTLSADRYIVDETWDPTIYTS